MKAVVALIAVAAVAVVGHLGCGCKSENGLKRVAQAKLRISRQHEWPLTGASIQDTQINLVFNCPRRSQQSSDSIALLEWKFRVHDTIH
jgi:hypothetical protein